MKRRALLELIVILALACAYITLVRPSSGVLLVVVPVLLLIWRQTRAAGFPRKRRRARARSVGRSYIRG